jgi:hypothetical protein
MFGYEQQLSQVLGFSLRGGGISLITTENNNGNMTEVTTLVHTTTKRGRMLK